MNLQRITLLSSLFLLAGLMLARPASAELLDEDDAEFLQSAAIAGSFEIQAAELAKAHTTDPKISSYAAMMITDHTRLADGLTLVAQDKSVSLPTLLDDKHGAMLEELAKRSRTDEFDETYVEVMDQSHDDAVDLFEQAAEGAKDADVRAFAQQALPVITMHHQTAGQLD